MQAPGMTFLSEKDDLPSCFQPALPRNTHGRASLMPQVRSCASCACMQPSFEYSPQLTAMCARQRCMPEPGEDAEYQCMNPTSWNTNQRFLRQKRGS